MVDRVKPLKIEEATNGTESNYGPTELDPNEDYIAAKGISFENTTTHLIEKLNDVIGFVFPDRNLSVNYNSDSSINYVEYFKGETRIARVDLSYTSNNPTSEVWRIYAENGSDVLRTITINHTFSNNTLTTSTWSTT